MRCKPNEVRIEGDCAYLQLIRKDGTVRAEAIIDLADLERVQGLRWKYNESRKGEGGYVRSSDGKVYLHAYLMQPGEGLQVDHINLNRLDNRRSNLRVVTQAENMVNRTLSARNSSGYKGVTFYRGQISAQFQSGGKKLRVTGFASPEDAARCYDNWAREAYGATARVNFPRPGELGARPAPTAPTPRPRAVVMPRLFDVEAV